MTGPRVLVTRPRAQAATWVADLQAAGLDAVSLPLIEIAPVADDAPLRAAWRQLAAQAFVMFVSANAVEAFFASRPDHLAWPPGTQAGATGPGTVAALRQAGVPEGCLRAPAADAPSFDAEALWAVLALEPLARWHGARVLVVRGEDGREWLAERFREHGAEVDYLAAYRRVVPPWSGEESAVCDAALARPEGHVWLFLQQRGRAEPARLAAGRGLVAFSRRGHACAHRRRGPWPRVRRRGRVRAAASGGGRGSVGVCRPVSPGLLESQPS